MTSEGSRIDKISFPANIQVLNTRLSSLGFRAGVDPTLKADIVTQPISLDTPPRRSQLFRRKQASSKARQICCAADAECCSDRLSSRSTTRSDLILSGHFRPTLPYITFVPDM